MSAGELKHWQCAGSHIPSNDQRPSCYFFFFFFSVCKVEVREHVPRLEDLEENGEDVKFVFLGSSLCPSIEGLFPERIAARTESPLLGGLMFTPALTARIGWFGGGSLGFALVRFFSSTRFLFAAL